jgi:hypothetical protein
MAGAAQFRDFSASDNLRQLISIKIPVLLEMKCATLPIRRAAGVNRPV